MCVLPYDKSLCFVPFKVKTITVILYDCLQWEVFQVLPYSLVLKKSHVNHFTHMTLIRPNTWKMSESICTLFWIKSFHKCARAVMTLFRIIRKF